tara:strand:+ start:6696 stop:6941 length:246 start_codon:yes stop_codon:yes gene_type:complete
MYRLVFLFLLAMAGVVVAQDDESDAEAVTENAPETVEELTAEELDDLDLDRNQDHTEEDEDVFRPSDVVSYQQSVPFPVDI